MVKKALIKTPGWGYVTKEGESYHFSKDCIHPLCGSNHELISKIDGIGPETNSFVCRNCLRIIESEAEQDKCDYCGRKMTGSLRVSPAWVMDKRNGKAFWMHERCFKEFSDLDHGERT